MHKIEKNILKNGVGYFTQYSTQEQMLQNYHEKLECKNVFPLLGLGSHICYIVWTDHHTEWVSSI